MRRLTKLSRIVVQIHTNELSTNPKDRGSVSRSTMMVMCASVCPKIWMQANLLRVADPRAKEFVLLFNCPSSRISDKDFGPRAVPARSGNPAERVPRTVEHDRRIHLLRSGTERGPYGGGFAGL